MKKLLLITAILLTGLTATAQIQLNPVDITNLITQNNGGNTTYLILGAFTSTEVEGGKNIDCSTHFPQQLNITPVDDTNIVEVTAQGVIIANAEVNIADNVILITNNNINYSDGSPFVASNQTTVFFEGNCEGTFVLGENTLMFNTIEEYQQTLSIGNYILNNPEYSFNLRNMLGQTVYKNRKSLVGIEDGFWIAEFNNGYRKTFVKQ